MPTFRFDPTLPNHELRLSRAASCSVGAQRTRPERQPPIATHPRTACWKPQPTGGRVQKSTLAYESARAFPYANVHFGTRRHHPHRAQGSRSGLPVGREPPGGTRSEAEMGPASIGQGSRSGLPVGREPPGGTRSEAEMGPASIGKGYFRVERRRRWKPVC
jgi:hypothetical protein